MKNKALIAVTSLLLPLPLAAQSGPGVEKSAAQITCELAGDCDAFNQEMATRDEGLDRGFSLRLPSKSNAAPGPAGKSVSSRPATTGRYTPPINARPVASAPGRNQSNAQKLARKSAATQSGRSSLAIGFASGSDTFTDSGLSQARKLLEAIRNPSNAGKRFLVAGHTDSVGSRELNLQLSRRRADALVKFLVENSVDPARLEAKGFGLDQPIAGMSSRNGANRRVEIVAID